MLVVAVVGVVLAVYELVAVKTRRVPTVTGLVKSAGWPARIFVAAVGSLALLDHFLTGFVL